MANEPYVQCEGCRSMVPPDDLHPCGPGGRWRYCSRCFSHTETWPETEQTSPERDAVLADWHQKRLSEANRVATHALSAIAGGDIYPQKLAQQALDLMRRTDQQPALLTSNQCVFDIEAKLGELAENISTAEKMNFDSYYSGKKLTPDEYMRYRALCEKSASLRSEIVTAFKGSRVETQAPLCIDCLELKNALAAAVGVANEAREQHDRDNDMRVMKLLLALAGDVKGYRADTDRIHDVLRRATERFSVKAGEEHGS